MNYVDKEEAGNMTRDDLDNLLIGEIIEYIESKEDFLPELERMLEAAFEDTRTQERIFERDRKGARKGTTTSDSIGV